MHPSLSWAGRRLQAILQTVYPPRCLTCPAVVTQDHALCPECWREAVFIAGPVCDQCGIPLPGTAQDANTDDLICDDCLTVARPWGRGRAALLYEGTGRRLVLAIKHGDR